jgi:RNA polymerase sigma-70 factor (ECF subfamily)
MGGQLGFESFYAAEFQRVFKAIYLTSGDRELAQDVTQEAFKRAFTRWGRLREKPWAGGWVMTTALNLMRKELKRPRESELKEASMPPVHPDRDVNLVEALRGLPRRQMTAALLYYVGDLSVADIAQAMDLAEGTVKALLSQARDNLRKSYG